MAVRLQRKLAILAKIEAVEATDAAPVGATNAIQVTEATLTPLQGQDVSRDLLLPYFGMQGVILTNNYATLAFQVETAGSGVAGTAPAYGPLLRGCAMAEVVTAGTDVKYSPVSAAQESLSIYFNRDGVRHVLLGARGTVSWSFVPAQIPRMSFTFTGLLGTITDTPLPTVDLTKFKKPVVVSKANSVLTAFGGPLVAESVSFDLANQIEPRFLIGDEGIRHVERQSTGQMVVEAKLLAEANWFDRALQRTRGSLSLVHGTVAGNIVQVAAPSVEVGRPTEGETQRVSNYTLPLMICPTAGNDELVITVK